jgi:hypothetical protein
VLEEIKRRKDNLQKPMTAGQLIDKYFSLLQDEISRVMIEEEGLKISGILRIRIVKDKERIRTYSKLSRKLKKKMRGL